jgi:hypothetical protein
MKQPIALLSLAVFATIACSAQAELTKDEKEEFVRQYRLRVKLAEEFPDKQAVKVIFYDLDFDGKEEALATSIGSFYETGWDWAAFKRNGTQWDPIKGYDSEAKIVRPGSGVYARPGEIFCLRDDENTVQFVVLNRNYDKWAPDKLGELNKIVFHIDGEGVFQQAKVQNLERLMAYRGARTAGIVTSFEALKVEEFPIAATAQTQQQNEAQRPKDGAAEMEKPKE